MPLQRGNGIALVTLSGSVPRVGFFRFSVAPDENFPVGCDTNRSFCAFHAELPECHLRREVPADSVGVDQTARAATKRNLHQRIILSANRAVDAAGLAEHRFQVAAQESEGIDKMHGGLI